MRSTAAVLLAIVVTACATKPSPPPVAFVRQPGEGEKLLAPNGTIVVKADPTTGAFNFAMGTQELQPHTGIPLHVHENEDEILFVHAGTAVGTIGDEHVTVPAGSTIFIPRGTWHGVANGEGTLSLVWFVSPPGLESFFRATRSKPGEAPKALTKEELDDVARKHHMRFAPPR